MACYQPAPAYGPSPVRAAYRALMNDASRMAASRRMLLASVRVEPADGTPEAAAVASAVEGAVRESVFDLIQRDILAAMEGGVAR